MEYRTKCKDGIMLYLLNHKEKRFDIKDIQIYLKKKGIDVNVTTIYRNIERLSEKGVILKYKSTKNDGYVYQYADINEGCHAHIHMQCKDCGEIIHLDAKFMEELEDYLLDKYSYTLDCSASVFIGLCKKCKKGRRRRR